jgi:3-hydroxyacyl-CoA dehydrogenase
MRWGFGMKQGPFELWQEAGWLQVAQVDPGRHRCRRRRFLQRRCRSGCSRSGGRSRWRAHGAGFVERDRTGKFVPQRVPAGARPPAVPRTAARRRRPALRTAGTTLHEDKNIRLWTLDQEVLIASLKTKMHTISPEVCEGLQQAIEMAEKDYQGMVIWSGDEPFSAGADLESTAAGVRGRRRRRRSRMRKASCSRPCCA